MTRLTGPEVHQTDPSASEDQASPSGDRAHASGAPGAEDAEPESPDPDLDETYWQPFRYSPEEDEALCFGCGLWLGPLAFERDADGIPDSRCRGCGASPTEP